MAKLIYNDGTVRIVQLESGDTTGLYLYAAFAPHRLGGGAGASRLTRWDRTDKLRVLAERHHVDVSTYYGTWFTNLKAFMIEHKLKGKIIDKDLKIKFVRRDRSGT